MASTNNQSNAPDSWDTDVNEAQVDDTLDKPLAALNINAPSFVPGQNPYAYSFVPSGGVGGSDVSGKSFCCVLIVVI